MHPILYFIFIYFIINYSFALFQFLVYPLSVNVMESWKKNLPLKRKLIPLTRIIKINADLAIISIIAILCSDFFSPAVIQWGIFILFVLNFSYIIYFHTIKRLYNTLPNFLLDSKLIQLGVSIVYHGYRLYFVLGILAIIFILIGYYFLAGLLIQAIIPLPQPYYIAGLLFLLALHCVYLIIKNPQLWSHSNRRTYSNTYLIYGNIKESLKAHQLLKRIKKFKNDDSKYSIPHVALKDKPNVMFLFVESYGKILFEKYGVEFKDLTSTLEEKLNKKGIGAVSNLSWAPRLGGGSWLCYSSFLHGIEVENEGLFRVTLEKENAAYMNPSLLKILNKDGYENFLLNPLTGFKNLKINWEEIKELFSAKDIIKFEDLEYKGQLVGALGLQPPDQFSLHKGFEILQSKRSDKPYALFFETLNSHAKWQSPIHVEKDWKTYDNPDFIYPITKMNYDSYFPAMDYQLSFLVDFITKEMDDNTVIMIMGDHQPPLITNPNSGNETPVHIIAKNRSFLEQFKEYGFEDGLWVDERKENNMTHAGMYYAFLRSLIKEYGEKDAPLPQYMKKGFQLD
ncbi:MAG: hypothetical protein ACI94Y_003702 [Maribacter sp.]|jgi:hypothetical protein